MTNLDYFFSSSQRLINRINSDYKRFLYDTIDWQQPLIFIVGMRGVGKTTLILQYLKTQSSALYITADDINLADKRLVDIAASFALEHAGKVLAIDEIHKYPDWNQELKNIHDLYPDLKVICSGSSSLDILKGQYDLSRRSLLHFLPHLSFREFINLSLATDFESSSLSTVLSTHEALAKDIVSVFDGLDTTILASFADYLRLGAYPYFQNKSASDYQRQVMNAITKVIYEDMSSSFNLQAGSAVTLQKLINLLTTSNPFEPNIDRMAKHLQITRPTLYLYLDYLEQSSIISFLKSAKSGTKLVRKPAKIFLANPTLYLAIAELKSLKIEQGTLRESFFLSQLAPQHGLVAHDKVDFEIDAPTPIYIEVGGKHKSEKQLLGLDNAYRALDGIEYGFGNTIPLWLFGFLY